MRKLAIRFFNDVPVVVLTVIESIIIFAATMVAKLAFTQIAPLPAAWWRVGFALLLLWVWRKPWKKFTEVLPTHARGWLRLAALGISSVFMNTTFYMAIGTLNVGVAVAIEFIGPLAVAVMTGRHWREYVGIIIAVCGIVTLSWSSFASQNRTSLAGLAAILISGVLWGTYIISGRRIALGGRPLDSMTIALTIGFAAQSVFLMLPGINGVIHPQPSATWLRQPWGPPALIALMFCVALCASFLPYIFDLFIMRRTLPSKFSVMQSISPAVATVIGLFFGEVPTIVDTVGIGLIIVAVFITFSSDERAAGEAGAKGVQL